MTIKVQVTGVVYYARKHTVPDHCEYTGWHGKSHANLLIIFISNVKKHSFLHSGSV